MSLVFDRARRAARTKADAVAAQRAQTPRVPDAPPTDRRLGHAPAAPKSPRQG